MFNSTTSNVKIESCETKKCKIYCLRHKDSYYQIISGQKFAMLEIKSVVSKMLRNYVLHPGGPEHEVILVAETVLTSRNGINLKLTRREW